MCQARNHANILRNKRKCVFGRYMISFIQQLRECMEMIKQLLHMYVHPDELEEVLSAKYNCTM